MNAEAGKGAPETGERHKKEFEYFVDGKQFKTTDSALSGAQIKARIPDFNPSYQLVLEGRGGNPDKVITDVGVEKVTVI